MNKEKLIEFLVEHIEIFPFLSSEYKNDKEIVITVLNELEVKDLFLKGEEYVVEADILKYINEELKNDDDVTLAALSFYNFNLLPKEKTSLSKEKMNNKEFMLNLVSKESIYLQYASDELQDDKEVVMAAVNKWGNYLKFASPRLKADKEVVLAAVKNAYDGAIDCFDDILLDDRDVMLAAIEMHPICISWVGEKLAQDSSFYLEAIAKNPEVIKYLEENDLKTIQNNIHYLINEDISKNNIDENGIGSK